MGNALPMLLLASFGRHQTCSSVNDSTQPRSRGQYCSNSFERENWRKRLGIENRLFIFELHLGLFLTGILVAARE